MNTRTEHLLTLAAKILETRDELAVLELQLDQLTGGGEATTITRPGRGPEKGVTAGEGADGGAALPPAATRKRTSPGSGAKPSEHALKAIALAKDGMGQAEIAAELGLTGRGGLIKVRNYLYRARKAGSLPNPKAVASR